MTWGTHAEDNETAVTTFDDMMSGWFKYVQTEDGSIPAIFHAKGEDISSKKALQQLSKPTLRAQVAKLRLIYSQFIFQNIRKRHTFYSLYTTMCSFNNNGRYEASAQDREDGVRRGCIVVSNPKMWRTMPHICQEMWWLWTEKKTLSTGGGF